MECRTLRQHLKDLVNEGYLQEFILDPRLPSKIRVQRQPKSTDENLGKTFVQYREGERHLRNSPKEGTSTKERTIYINEARRDNYPAIVTCPSTSPGRQSFSEEDAYSVHFPNNDALVVTVHIGCCKVSEILVDGRSSVNIMYGHALYRMEDLPSFLES